jgi:predicted nucleotidyltransferase
LFRGQAVAEALTWLALHADGEYSLSDLSRSIGAPLSSLHREINRLVTSGVLAERSLGRNRMLRINQHHPAYEPLSRLLEITFGPISVIADSFADLGADRVIIFGSWAARHAGTPGPFPNDIDVLVVGTVDRAALYEAADTAQLRLGLPVNPVMRTAKQWLEATDVLTAQIQASAHLTVIGDNEA